MYSLKIIMHSLKPTTILGAPSAIKDLLLDLAWSPPHPWGLETELVTTERPEEAMWQLLPELVYFLQELLFGVLRQVALRILAWQVKIGAESRLKIQTKLQHTNPLLLAWIAPLEAITVSKTPKAEAWEGWYLLKMKIQEKAKPIRIHLSVKLLFKCRQGRAKNSWVVSVPIMKDLLLLWDCLARRNWYYQK